MLFRQLFDRETATYTYLLADEQSGDAVIIDTVDTQIQRDLKLIEELELNLLYTLETHVHADHITGSGPLREATGAQIAVPSGSGVKGADRELGGGDVLTFGGHRLEVIETPGHTATCRSYLVDGERVFTGDALFIRGTGRTDFQGGSATKLYQSITEHLFALPDHVRIYPGHDYRGHTVSTIGEEKRLNPRIAGKTVDQFAQIMADLNLADPKRIHEAVPGNLKCGLEAPDHSSFTPLEVAPAWVAEHLDDIVVIDVRNPDEWAEEPMIEGALGIPLPELAQRLDEVPQGQTLVINCAMGGRSKQAVELLRSRGFDNAWSLVGGIRAWRQTEQPVST